MVQAAPTAALAGIATRITGYTERTRGHFRQHEAASLTIPLVISFGDPFAIRLGGVPSREDRIASFAAGIYAGPVLIDSFGASSCIQIDLTPSGARRIFGLPMHEIAGCMAGLDDVLGKQGAALREELGNEGTWQGRFAIALRFMEARLAVSPPISRPTEWALSHIMASGGRIPVGRIAERIGWSRKHLAERFRDEIGAGPKTIARIARLHRAFDQARAGRDGWAEIAFGCGYADQAHLTREFAALAGATPAEWRARLM